MFKEEDLKFTKIRDHRINFRYKGTLYSLNEHNFYGEYCITLCNRDTEEVIAGEWGWLDIDDFIRKRPYLGTINRSTPYSHIDKEHFVKKLNNWILENI